MNGSTRLGYIPALDGLRGVAILMVMMHHLELPWFSVGFLGVDIFFVLSGFLITSLLVREWQRAGSIDLTRFYYRRALRLLPCLICVIAAALAGVFMFGTVAEKASTLTGAWSSMLYVSNWTLVATNQPVGLGPLSTTWSLAIEDQFYIVWALSLPFLLRRLPRPYLLLALCMAGVLSVFLCYFHFVTGPTYALPYLGSDSRAVALICGCLLALLYTSGTLARIPRLGLICSTLVGAGIVFAVWVNFSTSDPSPPFFMGGFGLIAVSSAALIGLVVVVKPKALISVFSWRPLVWVGTISYGLYLWHALIFFFLDPARLSGNPLTMHIAALFLSFNVAFLSYRFIERPFLRLKAKVSPSTGQADNLLIRAPLP